MALWSLIEEKTGLTDESLIQRVKEIDLRDGRLDGKVRTDVLRYSRCDRVMSSRHTRCLYCGAERLVAGAFDDMM